MNDLQHVEEYKVKQLQPNHADHFSGYKDDWLDDLFKTSTIMAQRKYDGERMLIHFNKDEVYCTSRRSSIKTNRFMENQDRLVDMPHLMTLDYTVIDCECYSRTWSDISSILHSSPERAIELQKTIPVWFACFDCLFYNGEDIRDKPYIIRLNRLMTVLDELVLDKRFHLVEFTFLTSKEEVIQYRDKLIDEGYEGCVIKSVDMNYYDKGASLKAKRFETVDVVVIDYQQGRGKYANTIGALRVGYYDAVSGTYTIISNVNCSTDEERNWWRDNWTTARYSVIEVKCQEITEKSLRHPVYLRRRDDKSFSECTKETIFK